MKTHNRMIVAMFTVLLLTGLCLLPLARRSREAMEEQARLETQYREMTNALFRYQEVGPEDPVHEFFRERKDALVQAGYLTTRDFTLRHRFASKRAGSAFVRACTFRFPQVEWQFRFKDGSMPVVTVCARESDMRAIERFITQQDTGK